MLVADEADSKRFSITELAELGGVTRRTVRYYVQRELLPKPLGTGRGRHYSQAHLAALLRVVELQRAGVPLARIPDRLRAGGAEQVSRPSKPTPESSQAVWTRFVIAEGVEVHLQGANALDSARLARLSQAVLDVLEQDGE